MQILLAAALAFSLVACKSAPKKIANQEVISRLIEQGKRPGYLANVEGYYASATADKAEIARRLSSTLSIRVDERGLTKAAERMFDGEEDPTHYDAVWVRDNLWVYLGLKTDPREASTARRLMLTLSDYFSSPAQIERFRSVIANPELLRTPEGAMRAVHIRFDRKSESFADVQENGKAQIWNHKQNDALGLYLDLFCRALLSGEVTPDDLTGSRIEMIELFPRYFRAIQFASMADAGSWEEIERVNTSSIALVTSGLERLMQVRKFFPKLDSAKVSHLIDTGYSTIKKQLRLGGESPSYPKEDPRYRTADAALLNLIYPAQLARLKKADYDQVLRAVAPLIGPVGIKRYIGDSYQSGNFWFQSGKTDDTSSDASFAERGTKFIPESEAQWFFDSWYSLAVGILGRKYKDAKLQAESIRFLNRALAQITPVTPLLGADGKPVPPSATPESYNVIVHPKTGERAFAPSPITPLNWAKAALRLALAP